jgi:hypothetical protein
MICRKTMEVCCTPGMCDPHGGCPAEPKTFVSDSMATRPEFKGAVCKGSYALGSACGNCERCVWERENHPERVSAGLTARQEALTASRRAALDKILTSLECTAVWLEGGCNPIHAAEELRLNIAAAKKLRDES